MGSSPIWRAIFKEFMSKRFHVLWDSIVDAEKQVICTRCEHEFSISPSTMEGVVLCGHSDKHLKTTYEKLFPQCPDCGNCYCPKCEEDFFRSVIGELQT